jgi:hypothetical protein
MVCTVECCQMTGRFGGKIPDQGRQPPIKPMMPAWPARPVTHCFHRWGILRVARGHTHSDAAASSR